MLGFRKCQSCYVHNLNCTTCDGTVVLRPDLYFYIYFYIDVFYYVNTMVNVVLGVVYNLHIKRLFLHSGERLCY